MNKSIKGLSGKCAKTVFHIASLAFLLLFILSSFLFISSETDDMRSTYQSSQLVKKVIKDGKTERTDYVNNQGEITVAADLGYATQIKTETEDGILIKYYNEKGEPVSRFSGYYSVLYEYDGNGNNTRRTYMDFEGNLYVTKNGYAIEEREYNTKSELVGIRYYDQEGKPALSVSNGFGCIKDYDKNGNNIKTTYVDEHGDPMMTKQGYASVIREYYANDESDKGRVKKEFYFDEQEKPIALSLGQYGLYKEYNELGQDVLLTYLNANGDPIKTNKGYVSVIRSFQTNNYVATEQYLDINGNPYSLSEGQYGIKKVDGQKIYLDKNGNEQFNLKNLLYNQSGIIIFVVIAFIFFAATLNRKWNGIFLALYFAFIVYMTLLFRENDGAIVKLEIFWSYKKIITDSEIRVAIIRNIWLFIPLGAILYLIHPKTKILLIPVGLSILIEAIQYISGTGFCELDDVISNGLGGAIGYGMGCQAKKIRDLIL